MNSIRWGINTLIRKRSIDRVIKWLCTIWQWFNTPNITNHCIFPSIIQTNKQTNKRISKAKADKWKVLSLQLRAFERQTNKNANLYRQNKAFIWCVICGGSVSQQFDKSNFFFGRKSTENCYRRFFFWYQNKSSWWIFEGNLFVCMCVHIIKKPIRQKWLWFSGGCGNGGCFSSKIESKRI